MHSDAEEYLHQLNTTTELTAFGQEINDQTFAICKADMLIKGNSADFINNTTISKMKDISQGGSRIAIIHNGSPLFTGGAGSGPSEICRYILENDMLEAIVALPLS